jgi:hypothetical protein
MEMGSSIGISVILVDSLNLHTTNTAPAESEQEYDESLKLDSYYFLIGYSTALMRK